MPRSSLGLAVATTAAALAWAGLAAADDEPASAGAPAAAATPPVVATSADPLAAQLAAQADSVARALAIVHDKLVAADAARTRRARSAARVLLAHVPGDAPLADHVAAARRAAGARYLLARDASERALLADEIVHLRTSAARIAKDQPNAAAVTAAAPADLAWPARGTVARAFGAYEHERSHAQLSRRGLDLEVEDHAQVVSPSDGTVRYAGPVRGLDDGLVIDAGAYVVVIAKLAEPALPVGAVVHKGDRIGHAARHRIYLEVRLALGPGGLPIDPESVLAHDGHHPHERHK